MDKVRWLSNFFFWGGICTYKVLSAVYVSLLQRYLVTRQHLQGEPLGSIKNRVLIFSFLRTSENGAC